MPIHLLLEDGLFVTATADSSTVINHQYKLQARHAALIIGTVLEPSTASAVTAIYAATANIHTTSNVHTIHIRHATRTLRACVQRTSSETKRS
jgi:hypothetical protein